MVGPRSSRFTWWPVRLARAADGRAPQQVLVPGDPARPVQFSDARDIAAWSLRMLQAGRGGTDNTVGPGRPEPLADVLADCLRGVGSGADEVELVVVEHEKYLRGQLIDVDEEDRPLWYPEDQICQEAVDASAAAEAGLVFRPTGQTAADTLAWSERSGHADLLDGFLAREQALLRAWRAHR